MKLCTTISFCHDEATKEACFVVVMDVMLTVKKFICKLPIFDMFSLDLGSNFVPISVI